MADIRYRLSPELSLLNEWAIVGTLDEVLLAIYHWKARADRPGQSFSVALVDMEGLHCPYPPHGGATR